MKHGAYVWYDKVDKIYLPDSVLLARSERSVCRGFLNAFQQDRKMNPKEYELYRFGWFEDESCEFTPVFPPELIDPTQVYDKTPNTNGAVVDE